MTTRCGTLQSRPPAYADTNGYADELLVTHDTDKRTLRILIVEDEFLLACALEEDLRLLGHTIVGPFSDLRRATEGARHQEFDLAVLDINLKGEMVYPLADELRARQIPILLLSGYGAAHLPERFRATPRVSKPHDRQRLMQEIERALVK
jgi:CheY-like chemotaxis protein